MAVRKVPQVFRTSDGGEFDNEIDAERHEKVLTAKKQFDEAAWFLGAALVESYRTADGKPFDLRWSPYWVIADSWAGLPQLRRVEFTRAYWQEFRLRDDGDAELVFREADLDRSPTHYRVSELFADELTAKRALVVRQQERITQFQNGVDALRKEVSDA